MKKGERIKILQLSCFLLGSTQGLCKSIRKNIHHFHPQKLIAKHRTRIWFYSWTNMPCEAWNWVEFRSVLRNISIHGSQVASSDIAQSIVLQIKKKSLCPEHTASLEPSVGTWGWNIGTQLGVPYAITSEGLVLWEPTWWSVCGFNCRFPFQFPAVP